MTMNTREDEMLSIRNVPDDLAFQPSDVIHRIASKWPDDATQTSITLSSIRATEPKGAWKMRIGIAVVVT